MPEERGLSLKNLQLFTENFMRPPKAQSDNQQDLFRHRLENIINMRHELVILAHGIDWERLDDHFGKFFLKMAVLAFPLA